MSRWEALPEGVGSVVAIGGELVAAAALSSLMIWRNGELLGRYDSPVPNPGRLAVVGDRVHWGTWVVDAGTGEVSAGPQLSEVLPGYADGRGAVARRVRLDPGRAMGWRDRQAADRGGRPGRRRAEATLWQAPTSPLTRCGAVMAGL